MTDSFSNTEELLDCVQAQGQQMMRPTMQVTGELMLQTVYQYRMHIN